MESAEREILSLLNSVNSIFTFLFAVAVIALGLALVRPLNKMAGTVYAIAGAGRLAGMLIDMLVHALRPEKPELETVLLFSSISTAIWLVTSVVFFGGIMFATIKLAETHPEQPAQPARGAW